MFCLALQLVEITTYTKAVDSTQSVHMLQSIMTKVLASFWLAIGEVCTNLVIYAPTRKSLIHIFSLQILQLSYHQRKCFGTHMIWLILLSLRDIYHPIIHCTVIVKCELLNVLVMHCSTKSKRGHTFNRTLRIYCKRRTHSHKLIHMKWYHHKCNVHRIYHQLFVMKVQQQCKQCNQLWRVLESESKQNVSIH